MPEKFNPNREIVIRGAKEHNLKNIDLRLPRDKQNAYHTQVCLDGRPTTVRLC